MTINKAISKVDALKVNAFTSAQKAEWLTELEGKIYIEVLGSPARTLYPKSYYDYVYTIGADGLAAGSYYITVATKDYTFTLADALIKDDVLIVNTDDLRVYVNDVDTAAATQSNHTTQTDLTTSFESAADMDMLAPAPYDSLYTLYVCSMIDFYNQEIANYNNSSALFNKAYDEYRSYYRRSNRPTARNSWKLW